MKLRLNDFGGPSKRAGSQTRYKICPACGDNRWHCYLGDDGGWDCKKCGCEGYIEGAVAAGPALDTSLSSYEWRAIDPPPTRPLDAETLRYLTQRGVDRELAAHLGLRRLRDENRVYIPYRNEAGELIYWSGRSMDDTDPKYRHLSGIPHPLWYCGLPHAAPVVVEGVFDAIAVARLGFRGVAIGGKKISRHQWPRFKDLMVDRISDVIYIVLDGDAIPEAVALSEQLGLAGYPTCVIPLDPGEDPGGMDQEELFRRLV